MKIRSLLTACTLLILAPMIAFAGPIYSVNRSIGPGSVTGSIETDGTIGVLTGNNVIGWNLTIDDGDGTGPFVLNIGNSNLLLQGTLFSATAGNLLFDFSGSPGFALFQNPSNGSGINWWCLEGINSFCSGAGSSAETVNRDGGPTAIYHQGVVVVAGAETGSVPEPTSIALLLMGLAGLRGARGMKKRA